MSSLPSFNLSMEVTEDFKNKEKEKILCIPSTYDGKQPFRLRARSRLHKEKRERERERDLGSFLSVREEIATEKNYVGTTRGSLPID